jgi:hypothetical protein
MVGNMPLANKHRKYEDIPRGWAETTRILRGEKPKRVPVRPKRTKQPKSVWGDKEPFSPIWHQEKKASRKQHRKRTQQEHQKRAASQRVLYEAAGTVILYMYTLFS